VNTGKEVGWDFFRGGHACGHQSASKDHLYFRGGTATSLSDPSYTKGTPIAYDIDNSVNHHVTKTTRPGCWINMIAAGGLLSIPEASSGCTCDFPIQTSMAFITTKALAEARAIRSKRDANPTASIVRPAMAISAAGAAIRFKVVNVKRNEKLDFSVLDLSGRSIIDTKEIAKSDSHTFVWDNGSSATGIYLVALKTSKHRIARKLLLAK